MLTLEGRASRAGHGKNGVHVVHFYADEADLVAAVRPYLASGLQAGEVAIVIARPEHGAAFKAALEAYGLDLATARADERFFLLDAAETMASFITDGQIDLDAFHRVIGGLIGEALRSGRPVRVYGEMVALLWDAGEVATAIELEAEWNAIATELPFTLFCSYPSASVEHSEHADALNKVCALHTSVVEPAMKEIVSCSFEGEQDCPGDARRLVVATLLEAGHGEHLVGDVSLVVSELTSNAVRHADSPFTILVQVRDGMLRIAVQDNSPLGESALVPRCGHGLAVIEAIADRWGSEAAGDGKVVWAELSL